MTDDILNPALQSEYIYTNITPSVYINTSYIGLASCCMIQTTSNLKAMYDTNHMFNITGKRYNYPNPSSTNLITFYDITTHELY